MDPAAAADKPVPAGAATVPPTDVTVPPNGAADSTIPAADSSAPAPDAATSNGGSACRVSGGSLDIDTKRPEDFKGQVQTTNELPSPDLLKKTENYIVLDKDGKTHTFKSLYTGPNVPRRVLVVFVRHFFCGNCQEYLRTLAESITTESLLRLPVSTFITIVGCGDPRLIDMYSKETNCPFPIYTDPKGQLFSALGMVKTLSPGEKPAYMRKGMLGGALSSIGQGLRQISNGLALKAGDHRQVGGEFLFEPYDLATPITTPQDEQKNNPSNTNTLDTGLAGAGSANTSSIDGAGEGHAEEKKVSWCHRMRSTRDHTEMPELMEVLGLEGHGRPAEDEEVWKKALATRKGTGTSLAPEMTELTNAQKAA
ncbi:ahpC/TSA antioxidant enzyme domain-containing protein [Sarocladium implicatum]|nr:ahpC/TSA antioxidant enzyme domain-containing protein [Sarocladium implicatum]